MHYGRDYWCHQFGDIVSSYKWAEIAAMCNLMLDSSGMCIRRQCRRGIVIAVKRWPCTKCWEVQMLQWEPNAPFPLAALPC